MGVVGACIAALALAGAVTPSAARADIWKLVDRNGVVHLSDRPLGPGSVRIMRGKKKLRPLRGSSVRYSAFSKNQRRFTTLINRVASAHRIDRALIHAVVATESAYDPSAISKKGAVGLMQLMPGTAKRYGVRDRYDPKQNLYGGVRYLRDLLLRFDNVILALAAYNAGENAVEKYGKKVPPYPETRNYVRKVLTRYKKLRGRT